MINYKEKINYYDEDKNIIKDDYFTVLLNDNSIIYALVTRVGNKGNLYKFLLDTNEEKEFDRDEISRIYFPKKFNIKYVEIRKDKK